MEQLIVVQDLCKTFKLSARQQKQNKTKEKVKVAVDHLSFSVAGGEVFGLLGPNGAGKTTTLRMLSTLIRPDAGDVLIDGDSVLEHPDKVRKKIGFLSGDLKLEDFFTPDYLFDFFSQLHGVAPEVREQRKKALFDTFGIYDFAHVKVGNLSTGMKQKASLAVSLAHDPNIIVFDEPTNGLDVLTAKVVTDFLLSLKEQGKTVIVSTHIFNLIEKICDRVGIIIGGHMTVCDTLEKVCAGKPLEERFFDLYKEAVGEEV